MKCPEDAEAGRVCTEEVEESSLVSTQYWAGALACRDSTGNWEYGSTHYILLNTCLLGWKW